MQTITALDPVSQPFQKDMSLLVEMLQDPQDQTITAVTLGWPHLQAQGLNSAEALAALKVKVQHHLSQRELMVLNVTVAAPEPNPWLAIAGDFQEDPMFEEVQTHIADYRRELDQDPQSV